MGQGIVVVVDFTTASGSETVGGGAARPHGWVEAVEVVVMIMVMVMTMMMWWWRWW